MQIKLKSAKNFGLAIKKARKASGLTQAQLASLSNLGLRFIGDLENGKESCHLGLALKVAANLGLKIQADTLHA